MARRRRQEREVLYLPSSDILYVHSPDHSHYLHQHMYDLQANELLFAVLKSRYSSYNMSGEKLEAAVKAVKEELRQRPAAAPRPVSSSSPVLNLDKFDVAEQQSLCLDLVAVELETLKQAMQKVVSSVYATCARSEPLITNAAEQHPRLRRRNVG